MSHPYRPLFNELAEDVYALAKGMFEQAVANAQRPPPPVLTYKPGPLMLLRDALRSASFAQAFGERFAWKCVLEVSRRAMSAQVDFVVRHRCGHVQRLTIDEIAAVVSPHAMLGIGDALRAAQDREPRACYCTPRETS